jgi:outer membrane biosynthesis protein TonB
MSKPRYKIAILALSLVLLGAGCKKKQPKVPPPQAQAPTVTQQEPAKPETAPPEATATSEPKADTDKPPAEASKPKPKPRRKAAKPAAKKEAPVVVADNTPPPKIVIQEGGAETESSGQINVGISHGDSAHQKQNTQQLIDSTETNLKGIRRSLSTDEQGIVQQIRNYLTQSRSATDQGDIVRAHNLALKAHLLSDELVKR